MNNDEGLEQKDEPERTYSLEDMFNLNLQEAENNVYQLIEDIPFKMNTP